MRHSETNVAGWVLVNAVGADVTLTTTPWRIGFTEYQVFGVREGAAFPVGEHSGYTFR